MQETEWYPVHFLLFNGRNVIWAKNELILGYP